MRDLVLNHNFAETIAVEQNKFIRDKKDWTIRTETILKQYRPCDHFGMPSMFDLLEDSYFLEST